jgi:serine/threonine protein phosphatase PrpC
MTTQTGPFCPACGAPLQTGDRFCERCGAQVDRQEHEISRVELDLTIAAVVSDQGLVHRRNEDSFRLEVSDQRDVAAVVCDGISSASAGNVAAHDAAQAAGTVLSAAMADAARDASAATVEAVQAAQAAVERVQWTTRVKRVDPSCTLVSALCRDDEIVIGWVGDSRAYWVDGDRTRQLTVDDSFAEEGVAQGLLTPEQAANSPFLHSITNWVGPDAPARPPHLTVLRPEGPGRLVLCTDGLWNYAPTSDELGGLVEAMPAGSTPAAVAHSLVDMAIARGGHDNVTVAVIDIDPSPA